MWFFSVTIINDICYSLELYFACPVLSACPSSVEGELLY